MADASIDCTRRVELFAVTCSGCERLSRSAGLPLASLRAAIDAPAAIAAMNETGHAGWCLWPEGFQPFKHEDGWRDWRLLALRAEDPIPDGVRFANGRIELDLPSHVAVASFEAEIHLEFRRFGIAELTTASKWLVAQCDAGQPILIAPRYTLDDPNDFRAGSARVDDLFAIDPLIHVSLVAQAILRAKTRATRMASEALRHA